MNPVLAADRGTIPVRALRWLGRAGSVISIGMLIYFSASVGGWPTSPGWTGLGFLAFFAAGGMAIGWWREVAGGAVAIGCLGSFYALLLMFRGTAGDPGFLAFAFPGVLLFASGILTIRGDLLRRKGNCSNCGYDLRARAHAFCPECGAINRGDGQPPN